MGSVSKHAFDQVCQNSCCNITHPWSKSCVKGCIYMFTSSFIGTGKFFFLIYVIQHFAKNKSFTFETLKSTVVNYLRESCFGALMSAGYVGAVCYLRNVQQRYGYYSISLIPASIGGTAVFLIDPTRRGFSITTFQYLVLEITYKFLREKKIFKETVAFETTFFMICSSLLLYLLRSNRNADTFLWFFPPAKVCQSNDIKDGICPHTGSCWSNVLSWDTLKKFLLGFVIQLGRGVLVALRSRNFMNIWKLLFTYDTYLLGIFTGCYAIIYKTLICMLCQWLKYDSALFALPAGFIAGATYAIQPNLTIALIGITNIIKIGLETAIDNGIVPKFPWQEISFIISSGIIFHVRTMHPQICPKNAINLMSSMTNKRADETYEAFKKCIDITKGIQ